MNYLPKSKISSQLARKLWAYAIRIPHSFYRTFASDSEYRTRGPILVNSFPKSGTHLLFQIFENLNNYDHYGRFWASMPSRPHRPRTQAKTLRMLNSVLPGELVCGHLYYNEAYEKTLLSKNCLNFFIYRDLRDVAVSEAFYLSNMNRWHQLHPYFSKLRTTKERIQFSILGNRFQETPFDYPDIATRFKRYRRWIESENTHTVRFEDLVGTNQKETIRRLMSAVQSHLQLNFDLDAATTTALQAIDPQRSHTFRRGKASGWRDYFDDELSDLASEVTKDMEFLFQGC